MLPSSSAFFCAATFTLIHLMHYTAHHSACSTCGDILCAKHTKKGRLEGKVCWQLWFCFYFKWNCECLHVRKWVVHLWLTKMCWNLKCTHTLLCPTCFNARLANFTVGNVLKGKVQVKNFILLVCNIFIWLKHSVKNLRKLICRLAFFLSHALFVTDKSVKSGLKEIQWKYFLSYFKIEESSFSQRAQKYPLKSLQCAYKLSYHYT